MIQLLLMLFVGILLLCVGLFALVARTSKAKREAHSASQEASQEELLSMLRLPSLEFDGGELFSDADYRLLASEPKLHSIAREFRRDRKKIALEWLRELQRDVFSMWRFRAFLTRLGVTDGIRSEIREAVRSLLVLCLLSGVRLSVRLFGPYAFANASIYVRFRVEKVKYSCAEMLASFPRERWPQIAAEWRRAQAI